MLKLKAALAEAGKTQADLARAAGLSPATIAQVINHDKWPVTLDRAELEEQIKIFLEKCGAAAGTVSAAFEEAEAKQPAAPQTSTSEEDNDMLLRKKRLTPAAKKAFGIFREPFDDIAATDEMWLSPDIRYVRESMLQAARHGGFVATVGESGSGKSMLRRDLGQRIQDEGHPVILVEPYTVEAEDSPTKGKPFKSGNIIAALLAAVAPSERVKSDPQARLAQLHRALKGSYSAGYRHCVLIEEAHSLPKPALRHMKRILELELGFTKLVSVILIAQPELLDKLNVHDMDMREVVQRCEVVTLNPIDPADLQAFLKFRFEKAGSKAEFLHDSAVPALVQRLWLPGKKRDTRISNLHPLAIGNLVTAAMNLAAEIGVPEINAEVINGVG